MNQFTTGALMQYRQSEIVLFISLHLMNKDVEEYEAFQTFRAECKGIADNVMEQ